MFPELLHFSKETLIMTFGKTLLKVIKYSIAEWILYKTLRMFLINLCVLIGAEPLHVHVRKKVKIPPKLNNDTREVYRYNKNCSHHPAETKNKKHIKQLNAQLNVHVYNTYVCTYILSFRSKCRFADLVIVISTEDFNGTSSFVDRSAKLDLCTY